MLLVGLRQAARRRAHRRDFQLLMIDSRSPGRNVSFGTRISRSTLRAMLS
jgi:hypothetical protein